MRKRCFRILSLIIVACMLMTGSGISVYAESDDVLLSNKEIFSSEDVTLSEITESQVSVNELEDNTIYATATNPYSGGYGNCTWTAWQLAYDNTGVALPNLGNAGQWYDNAIKNGYTVGTTPKAPSIIVWTDNGAGHVAYVDSVINNTQIHIQEGAYLGGFHEETITYTTARWSGSDSVGWQNFKGFIYLGPTYHDPKGDVNSIEGGMGTIRVRGWAFDEDIPTTPILVHVYVGDSAHAGHSAEVYEIIANKYRADVEQVYPGVGSYHGFDETFTTKLKGTQPVYVYALNNKSDSTDENNPWIGEGIVTIQTDTQKPTISNLKVVSKDRNGYTLQCNVKDNVGVTKVQFSTCTVASGKTDWKHYEVTNISNGVATCTIKTSDFNNREGQYCTDIYAYDEAGNRSDWNASATYYPIIDRTAPVVVSGEITSVDDEGYTVTATATDNIGVVAIQFPTFTSNSTEEDIIWYEGTKVSDGTYTCRINAKDFNYENGHFCTDIRAYDADGNVSEIKSGISRLPIDIDVEAPVISDIKTTRISEDMLEISCHITDNTSVSKVAFPTWTETNGQDDLAPDWWNNCVGERNGDIWKFYVKDAEHNFEKSGYVTQIYAKDKYNNQTSSEALTYDIENTYKPHAFAANGHYYEIYDDLLTWNEAKAKCEELGGHLATVTSQEEQDAITNAIQSGVREFYYIGAEIGKNTWITGEPIDYTNWSPGQPSNSNGVEDIYEVYRKDGKWNDSCSTTLHGRGFICEYESGYIGDIPEEEIPEGGIPEGLWVSGLNTDGYPYTGKAIKPEVKVYHHNKLLKKNADYSIAYKNNTNVYVGDDTAKQPQIVVTGKGNYTGKEYVYFDILPKNISDADVQIDDIVKVYNGKNQATVPTIKWNGKKITYNKTEAKSNYIVHFSNDGNCTEVGEYTITIEGRGNYKGTNSCKLNIVSNKLLSKATVSMTKSVPYNNGQAVVPTKLVLKYGKTTLTENVDYTVKYLNNTQIGTATAVLTGIGEYSGTKKVNFTVTGRNISKAKVEGLYAKEYTGEAITQNPIVTYNKELLVPEVDYLVSYQKNINAGTATVIFTGINKYTGTLKKTFKIKPYSILTNVTGSFKNDPNTISVQYTKAGSTPDVEVMFKDKVLVKNVDYTLSYKNNGAVNDGSNPTKLPTITIKGKGNFKDSVTKTFTITAGDLSKDGVLISASDKVWKNKKNAYKSTPTIYDVNGKKLVAGKDYSKQYVYRYNNKNGAVIGDNEIPEALSVIYVEVTGINNYAGSAIGTTYRIAKQNISSAKVSVASQTYTGKPITITKDDIKSVKIGKTTLLPEEYEIVPNSYTNNVKKGTASVKIRGLGNYGGEKKITFKITSKKLLFDWSWLFG